MPVINRIADYAEDMKTWRRWLHANPELELDCDNTAAFVVERLKEFGVDEIHEGVAKTGVVAIINGQGEGPTIGLRADMDALPMDEMTGLDYASTVPGRMHACGHDGHTTMLLGAARYLAETRKFSGRVALLFQPGEEAGGGGELMVKEGVMDRFNVAEVYGIHNSPNQELGTFASRPGPLLAAFDEFYVKVIGKGGHAAHPDETIDPVPAITAMVQSLQTVVSRNLDPVKELVVSVTQIHVGSAENVIADSGRFSGTVRSFRPEVREMAEKRIKAILDGHAASFGVEIELDYVHGYPPTVNDPVKLEAAAKVAREVAGEDRVDTDAPMALGAEDFSYMLEVRPGAYLMLGQGDGFSVHHPKYDFNDEVAPVGASYFARLVETNQPL